MKPRQQNGVIRSPPPTPLTHALPDHTTPPAFSSTLVGSFQLPQNQLLQSRTTNHRTTTSSIPRKARDGPWFLRRIHHHGPPTRTPQPCRSEFFTHEPMSQLQNSSTHRVQARRWTWCTGIAGVPMPCAMVSQLRPLDAFLRNARLWVIASSTDRCIPTGCEASQLARYAGGRWLR